MRYIPPFYIFRITPDKVNGETLKSIQKEILAEFELQKNPVTVIVRHYEIDKSTLFRLIGELRDPVTFSYHVAISNDQNLLAFLTSHTIPIKDSLLPNPLYRDPDFIRFISPFFVRSFQYAILKAFRKRDKYAMVLLKYADLMVAPEDETKCYQPVKNEIERLVNEMEEFRKNKKRNFNLEEYADKRLTEMLGSAPLELKPNIRQYANELSNVAYYLFTGFSDTATSSRILRNLLRIPLPLLGSANIAKALSYVKLINESKKENEKETPVRKLTWMKVIVLSTFVTVIIYFVATHQRSSSESSISIPSEVIENYGKPDKDKVAETLAEYLIDYYKGIKNENVPSSDSTPANFSCTHPYENFIADYFNVNEQNKNLKLINKTGEDVLLLIKDSQTHEVTSLFIGEGQSCTTNAINIQIVNDIFLNAGKNWTDSITPKKAYEYGLQNNSDFLVNDYFTLTYLSKKNVHGAFAKPDTSNMDYLDHPYYLSPFLNQISQPAKKKKEKEYTLTIRLNDAGKIEFDY